MSEQTNPETKKLNPVAETVVIVLVALLLAFLIQLLLVKPYKIPSPSMVPTLDLGQRVLVNRVEGRFGTPERGDITVFNPPPGANEQQCGVQSGETYGPAPGKEYIGPSEFDADGNGNGVMPCPQPNSGSDPQAFIKRVVGIPGDRLKIIKGHVYINGKQLVEPYINPVDSCEDDPSNGPPCTYSREITIQPDHFFMMGDNRNNSDDSRFWGPVPADQVIGEAFATYWPPSRIGGL